MKVGNRKQIAFAVFYPGFPLGVLALGTMTVTAGIITDANIPAMIAPINMAAQRCATATLQRAQGPAHISVWLMLPYERSTVFIDYLGQFKGRSQSF